MKKVAFGWFPRPHEGTREPGLTRGRGNQDSRLGRSYYSSRAIARDASFFHIKK